MTTPHRPSLRRWTAYHDGGRTGPLVTGDPGTWHVRDDRVLAFVDDHTFLDNTHFETITQAALGTRLAQVTLIGDSWQTRRVGALLMGYWDAARPTPPKPKKLPAPPKPERARCGQPKARDGQPCQQPAGWGADPGERYCVHHGGSTAQQEARAQHVSEQVRTVVRLNRKRRTGALTSREEVERLLALREVLVEVEDRRKRGRS